MNTGFILTDLLGRLELAPEDKDIIEHPAIFGILLFHHNYESPKQLRQLTRSIHQHNPDIVIAVDQEGGRVQRFSQGFTDLKSMRYWGEYYDKDPAEALKGLQQQTKTMVTELQHCGVQVSLAPILDIEYGKSHIIGERSFHQDPGIIALLAKCVIDTMHAYKMPTIGKHFPGHGAVTLDSHVDLPVDDRPWNEIWEQDMRPYRDLIEDLDAVMPAHIIYPALDPMPAGFSPYWMRDILRNKINYQGLIISDDLSMAGAASMGDYIERAGLALEAGCNILTLCNNREGLIQLIDNMGNYYDKKIQEKIKNYISILS